MALTSTQTVPGINCNSLQTYLQASSRNLAKFIFPSPLFFLLSFSRSNFFFRSWCNLPTHAPHPALARSRNNCRCQIALYRLSSFPAHCDTSVVLISDTRPRDSVGAVSFPSVVLRNYFSLIQHSSFTKHLIIL